MGNVELHLQTKSSDFYFLILHFLTLQNVMQFLHLTLISRYTISSTV